MCELGVTPSWSGDRRRGMMRGAGVVVCVFWLMIAGLSAQTNTGAISGLVVDSSGGVLPGATIQASHPDTGAPRTLNKLI